MISQLLHFKQERINLVLARFNSSPLVWLTRRGCSVRLLLFVIIVPYPHCILITSSHKIKLWEESAPALATTTTTHKLANNTGTKRFQNDSPLILSILSITQIPLNNHNSKRNSKTKKGGGLAKHNARRQYKANIMI